ncbi:hypothetical protein WM03_17750 [Burkholderia ubonensis]|uniref:hypothetical protein n=1 Tax=Burkholderia ubonensis TaxID=101571 RepID=UPI00075BEE3D|nr:hypothetical protein [Burkholderia ubonensis]KVN71784.1 hypothetical protein WJ65_04085 [Burkholderia ubonensis]KWI05576.1 hypothetical protein WM02_26960 [Burkholderia ubonensis]KWI27210.1 hypothetical protein WM03_17750 [Burkholderia ubonensis]ODQ35700.1 hypothetical protein BGV63_18955 [Burkholderia ubonensis]OJA30632.1 hypothetical protein BGV58_10605 [Burkholderia ubonensis]
MTSRNPYLIEGPAQICFSGGRTSGYMLHQLLEANGGLPDDCIISFQNTGKEREETLEFINECSHRWLVPITWIEWDGFEEGSRSRCHVRIVNFETASREGEPFSLLNEALGIRAAALPVRLRASLYPELPGNVAALPLLRPDVTDDEVVSACEAHWIVLPVEAIDAATALVNLFAARAGERQ